MGDIWEWHDKGHPIVVPVNIGWKKNGENVMGRGIAKEAALRYPKLARSVGDYQCRTYTNGSPGYQTEHSSYWWRDVDSDSPIICLATKPLNIAQPWMSWKANSDLKTIHTSVKEFATQQSVYPNTVFPLLGCGNGGLSPAKVLILMGGLLATDTIVVVRPEEVDRIPEVYLDNESRTACPVCDELEGNCTGQTSLTLKGTLDHPIWRGQ